MSSRHVICPVDDFPPGERRIVDVDGLSIGVFNLDGDYYALANACPHQLAPLCRGRVTGTVTADRVGEYNWEREGQILRCPWHGWEFDITTGASVFNPHLVKAAQFDVDVEEMEAETAEYGTSLLGDEPPVETYEVAVESEYVVLFV